MQPGRESHANANNELFYRVSSCIERKDNLTMGELSNALSVPLSIATRIADWLVDNGYLQRLPDPEDRRVVRVALTDIGRELHQTIDAYVRQRIQEILSCLTDEERTMLLVLIGKVVTALKEAAR
jgi:DNA-binding MarR family transcriptional regulator